MTTRSVVNSEVRGKKKVHAAGSYVVHDLKKPLTKLPSFLFFPLSFGIIPKKCFRIYLRRFLYLFSHGSLEKSNLLRFVPEYPVTVLTTTQKKNSLPQGSSQEKQIFSNFASPPLSQKTNPDPLSDVCSFLANLASTKGNSISFLFLFFPFAVQYDESFGRAC
jgi:hypothetical protein